MGDWLDGWVDGLVHENASPGDMFRHPERVQPTIRIMLTAPLTAEITFGCGSLARVFYRIPAGLPGLEMAAAQPSKLHRLEVVFGMDELQAIAAIARENYAPAEADLLTNSKPSPGRDE